PRTSRRSWRWRRSNRSACLAPSRQAPGSRPRWPPAPTESRIFMTPSQDHMRQAMRLMQAGDLQAATRTLQDALAGTGQPAPMPFAQAAGGHAPAHTAPIEGEFRVVDGGQARPARASASPRADGNARRRFSCAAGELEYLLHI